VRHLLLPPKSTSLPPRADVAPLFEPSAAAIIETIEDQIHAATKPISVIFHLLCLLRLLNEIQTVFLVGGFAASEWLFARLQTHLQLAGLEFSRPDSHTYVVLNQQKETIRVTGDWDFKQG